MNKEKKDLKELAKFIYDWCLAIDIKGGGWDEWDYYYKDAYWNEDEKIYKLIRKYLSQEEMEKMKKEYGEY